MRQITIITNCKNDYSYLVGSTLAPRAWRRGQSRSFFGKIHSALRGLLRALEHSHWLQVIIFMSMWVGAYYVMWFLYYVISV